MSEEIARAYLMPTNMAGRRVNVFSAVVYNYLANTDGLRFNDVPDLNPRYVSVA